MATTYVPLATQTLSSAAATVTFSSIPSTYTDLVLVVSVRSARASTDDSLYMQFNSDTASNYSYTELKGNGSTASSARASSQTFLRPAANIDAASQPAGTFTPVIISINNYSNTTTYKTALSRNNMAAAEVTAVVGLWRSTAAISTISIYAASANLAAGSTFNLYGIASAAVVSGAKATGGDTVVTDGTYWYHAFRTSGTFTPTVALTADVLSVAGGGGGGYTTADFYSAAGGGAGGVITASSQSLTATGYSITVGAGGAGGTGSNGTNGSNSQFASLTAAVGGGAGSGAGGGSAPSGGSGGGSVQLGAVGTGTAGQGNNGGQGNQGGGGGGGAGAVGGSGSSPQGLGRPGGAGTNTYASWVNATGTGVSGFIAGGGGGGYTTYYLSSGDIVANGGSGGGGTGGADISGTKGLAVGTGVRGTGSGGGGAGGYSSPGFSGSGAGGSGLVIVRYAV